MNLRDAICGVSQERKILVQSLEMINGRVAMLATVGFALQEAYTGTHLIEEMQLFKCHSHLLEDLFYSNAKSNLFCFSSDILLGLPVIEETPDFFYPFFFD